MWLAGSMVILAVVTIILGPLVLIWSLNTLFGLGIAFSLKTWFAALWLAMVVGGSIKAGK